MASLILLIIVIKLTQSVNIINQIIEIKKTSRSRSSIETVETFEQFCEEEGLFSCKDRWNTCVDVNKICDGEIDCYNGHDEDNCASSLDILPTNSSCSNDEFVCIGANRTCQSKSSICDGIVDCPNGEDEEKCEESTTFSPLSNSTLAYYDNNSTSGYNDTYYDDSNASATT